MAKLIFDAVALRPIVRWTLDHAPHSPTFSQQLDPQYWKPGVTIKAGEWPKPEQLALEKLGASIHLVRDHGIYVLSSSQQRDIVDGSSSRIVYARGFDPSVDPEWWEAATQAVGGDDFVEALPIEWFTPVLEDDTITAVVIHVTNTKMRCAYQRRARQKLH